MTGPRRFEHYVDDEVQPAAGLAGRIRIEDPKGPKLTLTFDELRWLTESTIISALYALEAEATG